MSGPCTIVGSPARVIVGSPARACHCDMRQIDRRLLGELLGNRRQPEQSAARAIGGIPGRSSRDRKTSHATPLMMMMMMMLMLMRVLTIVMVRAVRRLPGEVR